MKDVQLLIVDRENRDGPRQCHIGQTQQGRGADPCQLYRSGYVKGSMAPDERTGG